MVHIKKKKALKKVIDWLRWLWGGWRLSTQVAQLGKMRRKQPRVPRRTSQEEEEPQGRKGSPGWGGKGSKRGGKVNRAKRCVSRWNWAAVLGTGRPPVRPGSPDSEWRFCPLSLVALSTSLSSRGFRVIIVDGTQRPPPLSRLDGPALCSEMRMRWWAEPSEMPTWAGLAACFLDRFPSPLRSRCLGSVRLGRWRGWGRRGGEMHVSELPGWEGS